MAAFLYKAVTADGVLTEGTLDAGGRQEAIRQLEVRGLSPVNLSEGGRAASRPAVKGSWFTSKKVSSRDLENFTRLLSSLLASGLPLSRALVILCKESSGPAREKWKEIHDLVIDGMSLADAMARSPKVFPGVYVAMVQAGETGGFLELVLSQIADFQAREKELRGKVTTALLYPAILLGLSITVLIFLLWFFIPKFTPIFGSFGAELPLLTRGIIAVSDALRNYGLFVLAGLGFGGYLVRGWVTSAPGRRWQQRTILRTPVLGGLVARYAMARFCRMLGTLLKAGVSLMDALRVARKSIGNQVLVDAVVESTERVKQGDSLAPSLAKCRDLFPGSVVEMLAVAEESGRLDEELIRISAVTELDLDRQMKTAVAMTEPLMLFFIAGFIGTIFIGMVIPIFSIQDHIK